MRKIMTTAILAATMATTVPVAASAHDRDRRDYYEDSYEGRGYVQPGYGGYYQRDAYAGRGYGGDYYRGYDRSRCHSDGSTGAIIGAIAGGLIGNGVAGRGDRTLGTILGGAGGLLAGRAIERSGNRC